MKLHPYHTIHRESFSLLCINIKSIVLFLYTSALQKNVLYFAEDKGQERYNLDFSLKKVLNDWWIDYDFFDAHNFEYSSKMDNLGWTPMTTIRDDVYPDLVAHFYANTTQGYHSEIIESYVKWVVFKLDIYVITTKLVYSTECFWQKCLNILRLIWMMR